MSDAASDAGIGSLLADIDRQAETERTRILSEAEARVADIRKKSEEEIRHLEAEAEKQLENRIAVEGERIAGRLEVEGRAALLAAKRAVMQRVFDEARRRTTALISSAGYPRLFERLVREAAEALGEGAGFIVASEDVPLLHEVLGRIGLSGEVRGEARPRGTVVAVSKDGLRRVDNSVAVRLARAERAFEKEVAGILFGEDTAPPASERDR